ncbi:MAG: class I SAM-dependent methyltransferase, partial [Gammaproteobacteria bacterium]|nr:class I SAM-dependent methyltransferase [Gammaproteobacteria bacterium]
MQRSLLLTGVSAYTGGLMIVVLPVANAGSAWNRPVRSPFGVCFAGARQTDSTDCGNMAASGMEPASMGTDELKTFTATYDWAKTWRDLPWAHEEPTLFLAELCAKRKPGRALDIGCGAGTDSVYLAQRGWEVTALDFIPKALEYTAARAREAGVAVKPVQADITAWQAEQPYDLVLDHGLLHNLDPVRHAAYRQTVLQALAGEGDFILLHWHPRFPGQGNGKIV